MTCSPAGEAADHNVMLRECSPISTGWSLSSSSDVAAYRVGVAPTDATSRDPPRFQPAGALSDAVTVIAAGSSASGYRARVYQLMTAIFALVEGSEPNAPPANGTT